MITFREERRNGDVIEHKIASDEVTLSEVLEQFEYFLKGCSYVFDGHVDIIDDEDDNNNPLEFSLDNITIPELNDNIDLWNVDGDIDMGPGHVDIDTGPLIFNLDDTYGATTTKLKDD